MGQMEEFFRCKGISRGIHNFLYQKIPPNTMLWCCETCALKEEEKRMIEVFHHGVIRRILGITRQRVCDERITNSAVRKRFLNLPTMMNLVKRMVIKHIGKVVREEKETALHKYLLTAYCHSPMHVGGKHNHTEIFS
jgi:hypothetical protein